MEPELLAGDEGRPIDAAPPLLAASPAAPLPAPPPPTPLPVPPRPSAPLIVALASPLTPLPLPGAGILEFTPPPKEEEDSPSDL